MCVSLFYLVDYLCYFEVVVDLMAACEHFVWAFGISCGADMVDTVMIIIEYPGVDSEEGVEIEL